MVKFEGRSEVDSGLETAFAGASEGMLSVAENPGLIALKAVIRC